MNSTITTGLYANTFSTICSTILCPKLRSDQATNQMSPHIRLSSSLLRMNRNIHPCPSLGHPGYRGVEKACLAAMARGYESRG